MSINTVNGTVPAGPEPGQAAGTVNKYNPAVKAESPAVNENQAKFDSLEISGKAAEEHDKRLLEELKRIDQEVQAHEAAHQAAAGEYFRGKHLSFRIGPDGKRYAVAGDVQIDTSVIQGNPKATIAKMRRIRSAALAPGSPSPQDSKVAADAAKAEMQAQQELQREAMQKNLEKSAALSRLLDNKADDGSTVPEAVQTQKTVTAASAQSIAILFRNSSLQTDEGSNIDISV